MHARGAALAVIIAIIVALLLLLLALLLLISSAVTIELETQEVAGPLDPAAPAPLTGVNAGPLRTDFGIGDDPAAAETAAVEYADLGVSSIRTHDNELTLDINDLYKDTADYTDSPTDEDSYNWDTSDAQFQAIVDSGVGVYLRIGGSSGDGTSFLPDSGDAAQWDAFVEVCLHIVRHYVDGWRTSDKDEAYAGPILGVEIWNEPGNTTFWNLGPDAFVDLFVHLVEALNQQYPGLKVGGPGFGWSEIGPDGAVSIALHDFMTDVAAHSGYAGAKHRKPAFISWHVYTPDPDNFGDAADAMEAEIEYLRTELNRLHGTGIQIIESHVSEWNTGGPVDDNRHGTGIGAAQLTGGWIQMQRAGVDLAHFHRGWDGGSKVTGYGGFGLLTYEDKERKTIAEAFDLWSAFLAERGQFLHAVPNKSKAAFDFLAQETAKGYMVLLANSGEDELKYFIDLPGSSGRASAASLIIEEIAADGTRTTPPVSGTPVKLPGHTVHLVRIGY